MSKIELYVLIGEHGEYEQFSRDVLGVFSSKETARAAIPKLRAYGDQQWTLYQERERKVKEYMKRFEPAQIYPPGLLFPQGHTRYTPTQHKESEDAFGEAPHLIPPADKYIIEIYSLDAIEEGHEVEEIDVRTYLENGDELP